VGGESKARDSENVSQVLFSGSGGCGEAGRGRELRDQVASAGDVSRTRGKSVVGEDGGMDIVLVRKGGAT
jgi:hypothetical protein